MGAERQAQAGPERRAMGPVRNTIPASIAYDPVGTYPRPLIGTSLTVGSFRPRVPVVARQRSSPRGTDVRERREHHRPRDSMRVQVRWPLTAVSFWQLTAVSFALLLLMLGAAARPAAAATDVGAETQSATNVLDDAVDLQGLIHLNTPTSGQYWFEYQRDVTPRGAWQRATTRSFAPANGTPVAIPVTERLRPDCSEIVQACSSATLTPSTKWIYRICTLVTSPRIVGKCFDAEGKAGGNTFDGFELLEPWDDLNHETVQCPVTASPNTGFGCYDPEGPTTLSHSPFSRHYTNTAHYGVGPFEYGTFVHGRDLVFNGRRAQIWQSGNVLSGPGLRYDFRMRVYRGEGHSNPVDSFRDIEPEGSFSTGNILSRTWFVPHHTRGPYHVHWRLIFRASGRTNPSRADGTFITPVTATPFYNCDLDADGERICRFPG
jgi:hypothetical protein